MQRLRLTVVAVAVVLLAPLGAYAQDRPKAGLVTGYPGSIGILFDASDDVAVRPEFSFSGSSADVDSLSGGNDTSRFGVGASVLFYLRKIDNLRLYVAPRLLYTRLHNTSTSSNGTVAYTATSNAFQPAGMFGAQYSLHRRFAVYGEAGASYSRATTKSTQGTSGGFELPLKQTSRSWGNTTAVGVIVYF